MREATQGLTASIGLSGTKYVAKVASAYKKPDGLTVVPPSSAKAWLAPLEVSWLWGAGPKTQARLHALGLRTIGDVANADPAYLTKNLGSAGYHFYALSHAEDPRKVARSRIPKSIGSEQTLLEDIPIGADLMRHLQRSADRIASRLKKEKSAGWGCQGQTQDVAIPDFNATADARTRKRCRQRPVQIGDRAAGCVQARWPIPIGRISGIRPLACWRDAAVGLV